MSIDARIKLFTILIVSALLLFIGAIWSPNNVQSEIAETGAVLMPLVIGSGIYLWVGFDTETKTEKQIRKENRVKVKADSLGR